LWCTGEDSNLRSSQGAADLQSAAINRSATCAHPFQPNPVPPGSTANSSRRLISAAGNPHTSNPGRSQGDSEFPRKTLRETGEQGWGTAAGETGRRSQPAHKIPLLPTVLKPVYVWSWRRDLNPRPSDYKSDALPAELRQPEQPSTRRSRDTRVRRRNVWHKSKD
jgi:septal ring-binding cell division protein DamX